MPSPRKLCTALAKPTQRTSVHSRFIKRPHNCIVDAASLRVEAFWTRGATGRPVGVLFASDSLRQPQNGRAGPFLCLAAGAAARRGLFKPSPKRTRSIAVGLGAYVRGKPMPAPSCMVRRHDRVRPMKAFVATVPNASSVCLRPGRRLCPAISDRAEAVDFNLLQGRLSG